MFKTNWLVRNIDWLLLVFLLTLLFALPVIFVRGNIDAEWEKISKIWLDYILLIPLFVINHWILVPKLLLKKKHMTYLASVVALISIITLSYYSYEQTKKINKRSQGVSSGKKSLSTFQPNFMLASVVTPGQIQFGFQTKNKEKQVNQQTKSGELERKHPPRRDEKNGRKPPPRRDNEDNRPPCPGEGHDQRPPRSGDEGSNRSPKPEEQQQKPPRKEGEQQSNRPTKGNYDQNDQVPRDRKRDNKPPRPKENIHNTVQKTNDHERPLRFDDNKQKEQQRRGKREGKASEPKPAIPPYANLLFLSLMVVVVDTGLIYSKHYYKNEQDKIRLENENAQVQLNMLQHQINPHFFMNTLNNIYSLIGSENELPRTAVMRLSKLMRFLLYENKTGNVLLSKEFGFIENFINLMKLRYDDNVEIKFDIPDNYDDVEIPSLLYISFLENAFKYGISYQQKSFVHTAFEIAGNTLKFTCKNSINQSNGQNNEFSGIGLQNSRERLDLLFPNSYSLVINNDGKTFIVELKIPLK